MSLSEAQIKILKRVTGKDEVTMEDYFNAVSELSFEVTKTDNEIVDVQPIQNNGRIFIGGLPQTKEYIMCSAIHFDDGKEHVHQPVNIKSGFVICGRRHHNCFYTASLIGQEVKKFKQTQGFLTNTNRFVDRHEGLLTAYKSKQTEKCIGELFREDVS